MNSLFLIQLSKNRPFLMGLSILSIMLFHQQWISLFPLNAFHIWGHYGVDVFLFVSGFGLAFSLQKNSLIEFYKRRVMRLLPLCIFCGICKYSIYSVWKDNFLELKDISWLTLFGLDLWFIQTISVFYLLAPFVYWILQKTTVSFMSYLFLLCLSTSLFIPEIQNNITGSIHRFPVFVLGMAFVVNQWDVSRRQLCFSFLFLLLAMLITMLISKDYFHWGNDLFVYPILSLGIPCLVYLVGKLKEKTWKKGETFINILGKHSLELYLWHEFVYGCIWLTLNGRMNNLILVTLAFALSFSLALFSRHIVDRLKVL